MIHHESGGLENENNKDGVGEKERKKMMYHVLGTGKEKEVEYDDYFIVQK